MKVHLWHGEEDVIVPPAMGRYVADRIPDCEATFLPGEGHFSFAVGHLGRILDALWGSSPDGD